MKTKLLQRGQLEKNHLITQQKNNLSLSGRINAAKLNSQISSLSNVSQNLAAASVFTDATQNALMEIISIAKKMQEIGSSSNTNDTLNRLGSEFSTQLNNLLETTIESVKVLQSTIPIDLGLNSGTIDVCVDLRSDTAYNALQRKIADMQTNPAVAPNNMDPIIDGLYTALDIQNSKSSLLENRYTSLNDLALSYGDGINKQVTTDGSTPSSLVNKIL